jgi:uncharacterized protein (DUF2342 family)
MAVTPAATPVTAVADTVKATQDTGFATAAVEKLSRMSEPQTAYSHMTTNSFGTLTGNVTVNLSDGTTATSDSFGEARIPTGVTVID